MRNILVLSLLLFWSISLPGQNIPNKLVHFPQYVVIGPSAYTANTPSGYNLLVEGGILTERLRVATRNGTNWADYVLAPSYKLTSLPQLEKFISQHHHLPGIPSANEIASTGIDVAQMQASMMAKIEELTLYVIHQDKELTRLRRQVRLLSTQKRAHQ